ncbi:hypothetical protein FAUST_10132 [Fusarium austroamericanum]|uniref:RanBP2-type domain-containing protein n=1 Tax=Fusarium austroamericanum TaxID=282268 RepID=A0AAN6BWC0_FUSAU|nr:hypothetical protein FAUST_10132 [Fusarium austroamericanum]
MPYKTTEPRDDHILWECKHLKDATSTTCCGKFNGMRDEKCGWCKANRDVGAMAVDRTRKTIGKLVEKNPDGLDVWKYDDYAPSTKLRSSVFSSGLPIDSEGVLPIYPASLAWSFKMY